MTEKSFNKPDSLTTDNAEIMSKGIDSESKTSPTGHLGSSFGKSHWLRMSFLFLIILVGLFLAVNFLFQPVWYDWNNYDTTYGFYEEPENTIETVFFGASIVVNGITPMELYEDYGICSYNLGTEQQPVAVSYYWLEEVYRLHGDSLKTVVFDVNELRREPDEAFYRKGLDAMKLSSAKWNAAKDYTDGSITEMLSYLVPVMSYHDRWTELGETDYTKQEYEMKDYTRGYWFRTDSLFDSYKYTQFGVVNNYVDADADELQLNTASLYYMRKMIEFCELHDLKLVLIRTPRGTDSSMHNAVQTIADNYDLDFFDFSCEPLVSEIGYNHALDSADGGHMNYYGATKLTSWIGRYLVEECSATDVRGNEAYQFMDEQLAEYHANVTNSIQLKAVTSPEDYLSLVSSNENYTVFLAVKDEGSAALTDDQKQYFASIGLNKLSEIGYRDSYLAVIDGGSVLLEQTEANPESAVAEGSDSEETMVDNDLEHITLDDVRESRKEEEEETETTETTLELVYEGEMQDGTSYVVKSGGILLGNVASVLIDGTEYAQNSRGINIVVYDKTQGEVVDSAVFDTCGSSTRDGSDLETALEKALTETDDYTTLSANLQKLYLYGLRCENVECSATLEQYVSDNDLSSYLETVMQEKRYAVLLSVMDEAANGLDGNIREKLADIGFTELSQLEYRDSYLALVIGGEVMQESRDHGESPISVTDSFALDENDCWCIESGGMESGNVSSIMINGKEYSGQSRGINIVVWDTTLGQLVDAVTFDSHGVAVH